MRKAILILLALCLLATPALAKKKGAPTAPGTYSEWNEEIDRLEVVATFKLSDYQKVVVQKLDTADTPLPEPDDNTYGPVQEILPRVAGPLAAQLGESLEGEISVAEGAEGSAGSLVVRGRVAELDPGSRAARYWGGFGAGAARVHLVLEVVDGGSGAVLLKIDQERRSGVGVGGGDYTKLLERNLRKIGEDVALVLSAF